MKQQDKDRLGVKTITLPDFTPSQKAQLALSQLASDEEIMPIILIGRGTLTPEQQGENEKRAKLKREKELAIIRRYGVEDEYIKAALKRITNHQSRISKIQAEIADEQSWIETLEV